MNKSFPLPPLWPHVKKNPSQVVSHYKQPGVWWTYGGPPQTTFSSKKKKEKQGQKKGLVRGKNTDFKKSVLTFRVLWNGEQTKLFCNGARLRARYWSSYKNLERVTNNSRFLRNELCSSHPLLQSSQFRFSKWDSSSFETRTESAASQEALWTSSAMGYSRGVLSTTQYLSRFGREHKGGDLGSPLFRRIPPTPEAISRSRRTTSFSSFFLFSFGYKKKKRAASQEVSATSRTFSINTIKVSLSTLYQPTSINQQDLAISDEISGDPHTLAAFKSGNVAANQKLFVSSVRTR